MIDRASIDAFLAQFEPEFQAFGRNLIQILAELEDDLDEQGLSGEELHAIRQVVFTALECHLTGRAAPSEEVAFWMTFLESAITLPVNSLVH